MKQGTSVASLQLNNHKKRSVFQRVVSIFAATAVFITCYVLIIPAITMGTEDADTVCGFVSHAHTDECYDETGELICGLPEHEHDMQCYAGAKAPEKVYACGYGFEHTHTDECRDENGELICELPEHTHTDECLAPSDKETVTQETVTETSEKTAEETKPEETVTEPQVTNEEQPKKVKEKTSFGGFASVKKFGADNTAFPSYLTSSVLESYGDANAWQIISGRYGDTNAVVDVDADNHMRARKRIIPTDTENEFLIDLSIDLDYRNLISTSLVNEGTAIIIQSSKQSNADDDGVVNQQDNCDKAWNEGKSTNANPAYADKNDSRFGGKTGKPWKLTFRYPQEGTTGTTSVSVTRYCVINTFSNGWVDMRLFLEKYNDYKWCAVGAAQKGTGDEIIIDLESNMVQKVLAALENVEIGTLQDSMGGSGSTVGSQTFRLTEGIDVVEIVYSGVKGEAVKDNAVISKDSDGRPYIEWKPVVSSLHASDTDGNGWFNNIAELVYKVKYTPGTSTGLSSSTNKLVTNTDAQIDTNKSTSIGYITTDTSGKTVQKTLNITSPVITGLLYEINATKVDNTGLKKLPGADFELYLKGSPGETDTLVDTTSSDNNGKIAFKNLPAGTYYLKETKAPEGYTISEDTPALYKISYTDGSPLKGQGKGTDALYNPATPITIVNMPPPAVELPHTGGTGTVLVYSTGVLLTLFSAVAFVESKKKQKLINDK